ncbi:tetratricopeptide repeat protein [Schinkia sp. CFF1]
MNINKKAIELLEENKYEESLALFQEAVKKSRDVQSLTNLAWIYNHEEQDYEKAQELLEEAITMNPSSYFPFSLLGEVYFEQEKWQQAKDILQKSLSIQPTKPAFNNLAVANYHLGNIEDAANYFLLASENADYALYSHIKCLVELGKLKEAKERLQSFSQNDAEFVGEVEVADLFVELDCYKEAVEWFEKGWDVYSHDVSWISRYVYALMKVNDKTRAQNLLKEELEQKVKEIKEAYEEECDDTWTENDKQEVIEMLQKEKIELEQVYEKIASGKKPAMDFRTSIEPRCYLFGCIRHNHPEYEY